MRKIVTLSLVLAAALSVAAVGTDRQRRRVSRPARKGHGDHDLITGAGGSG